MLTMAELTEKTQIQEGISKNTEEADIKENEGKSTVMEKTKLSLTETEKTKNLFCGLTLAALADKNEDVTKDEQPQEVKCSFDLENLSVSDKMFCSYCDCEFIDRSQQTTHYKTDWHRYNLKRKLKGQSSLSQESFEMLMGSDISSISGSGSSSDEDENDDKDLPKAGQLPKRSSDRHNVMSDSEDEESGHVEGLGRRHPRVFVRNNTGQLFSIYRCVIHGKKHQPADSKELLGMVSDMPDHMKWAIFMTAAGHVAAAIYEKDNVIVHKTFHRYTVRAKRGTAQGLRDSQGNAPHSAGASLRRYNEAALNQEVADLIKSWSEHLKSCDRIFLRAPSFNRAMFFSGKNPPLDKRDPRIRMVPFPTRRPTFNELKRVHDILATVESHGSDSTIHDYVQKSPKRPVNLQKKSKASQLPDVEDHNRPVEENDEEEYIDSGPLMETEVTFLTHDLQPFEATKKPRRKKKKKKEESVTGRKNVSEDGPTDVSLKQFTDEEYKVRNELYTACKIGETERVRELLKSKPPCNTADQKNTPDQNTSDQNTADQNDPDQNTADQNTLDQINPDQNASDQKSTPDQTTADQNSSDQNTPDQSLQSDATIESQALSSVIQKPASVPDSGKGFIPNISTAAKDKQNSDPNSDHSPIVISDVVNEPFSESRRTLLGVAATQNHREIVGLLLEAGANPTIRDAQNRPPYVLASEKATRNEFRMFMSKYPDRYDYTLAQIPAPLTAEMEMERKARELERKKAAKKAKKERLKDKKAEESIALAEKREEERFVKLSDREKRALAAERRFTAQLTTQGQDVPTLSRCWQCGKDMTGKVPFEYYDYKFCTPKCLKEHKITSGHRKS